MDCLDKRMQANTDYSMRYSRFGGSRSVPLLPGTASTANKLKRKPRLQLTLPTTNRNAQLMEIL